MWRWLGGARHETAQGQVSDDVKPHSKNGTFSRKSKKIHQCEYGKTQTINHLLQCLLMGNSSEKKNDLRQANDKIRYSSHSILNDCEKEEGRSQLIPFERYRHLADTVL